MDSEIGQGLMEVLRFHPSQKFFIMAGRMFKGSWKRQCLMQMRVRFFVLIILVCAVVMQFSMLMVLGCLLEGKSQSKKKDGTFSSWGRVLEYEVLIKEEKS